MTTKATSELEALGFSEYEARAYLALLQGGPQTGYQLAKASGIPRPNIYPVLARLVQRGAANTIDAKGAVRYSALPSAQMIENAERDFSAHAARARQAMPEVEEAQPDEQIWNIEGYDQVIARAREMVDRAKGQLVLGVWSNEAAALADHVARAERRGVDLTTLCVQACPEECGGCAGRLYRYDVANAAEPRTLVVIRDRTELLVGQCYVNGTARGAITRMTAFIGVATQFIENTVAVAEIARCLGSRLPGLLDEEARDAIKRTGVRMDATSWLNRLISSGGSR